MREYFPYLHMDKKETVRALTEGMKEAIMASERENLGRQAKKFIDPQKQQWFGVRRYGTLL